MHCLLVVCPSVLVLFWSLVATELSGDEGSLELRDSDRVVLVGNAFVQRLIEHNYLETLLTTRSAERNITCHNLGRSSRSTLSCG